MTHESLEACQEKSQRAVLHILVLYNSSLGGTV
jgi:hypothetical protein